VTAPTARSGQVAFPARKALAVEGVGGLAGLVGTLERRLSQRQREAVAVALELGYYEIPRETDHEAVADALECAPSTAAEHLRKAEAKLIPAVVST